MVLHYAHAPGLIKRRARKTRTMVDYEAALSNARTSLDGTEERASLQILTDARDAIDSRSNPYLEYSRIKQIRKCPEELTYDLVTSDHHYIADGVVVHNCDIDINNNLKADKYKVEKPWFIWDEQYRGWAVEDIYAAIDKCSPNGGGGNQGPPSTGSGAPGNMPKGGTNGNDMAPAMSIEDTQRAVNNVIQAAHMAIASGNPGAVPGSVVEHINKFLDPVVPWDVLLDRFLEDRCNDDYSYARPNRRYPGMYLPCLMSDERLTHLAFYWDVSGSTTGPVTDRMNSEVKAIKNKYNPDKMTIIMFDTKIQKIVELTEDDPFDGIDIEGRGGTCFKEVRKHIMDTNPTCAIVFSDMWVTPMEPGPQCPILWIGINNRGAKVPFGQIIYINA